MQTSKASNGKPASHCTLPHPCCSHGCCEAVLPCNIRSHTSVHGKTSPSPFAVPLVVPFQLRAPLLLLHFSHGWWDCQWAPSYIWKCEETLPPAFPSLNKTGLSLVLLSRKALDLHGHRLTHSPEGPRTCFSYLICSCWGFYTCVLDNLPRHCRSKKASFETKDLKPPEGLSGSSVFQHIPLAFFLLSCSLCAFISFWAPTGLCSEAHYCWHKERQRRGGTSPGADPPGQTASFLLCGAMWDDLIQPQHVQHALSGV